MPDNPTDPDRPASGELPPEPPRADDTAILPPEEPPPAAPPQEPREPSRFRRAAGSKTAALVAAGLAGVLIGAGTMALIAFTGDDDRDDRRSRAEMFRDGDGPYFDKRGPMMREMRPWRGNAEPMEPGERGEKFKQRLRDLLTDPQLREHHHDEDGNMVPGPAPKQEEGGN